MTPDPSASASNFHVNGCCIRQASDIAEQLYDTLSCAADYKKKYVWNKYRFTATAGDYLNACATLRHFDPKSIRKNGLTSTTIQKRDTRLLINKGYVAYQNSAWENMLELSGHEIEKLHQILKKCSIVMPSSYRFEAGSQIEIYYCSQKKQCLINFYNMNSTPDESVIDLLLKIPVLIFKLDLMHLKCGIQNVGLNIHAKDRPDRLPWHYDNFVNVHKNSTFSNINVLQTCVLSTSANDQNKQYMELGLICKSQECYADRPPEKEDNYRMHAAKGTAEIDSEGFIKKMSSVVNVSGDRTKRARYTHASPDTVYLVEQLEEKKGTGYEIIQTMDYQMSEGSTDKFRMVHSATTIKGTSERPGISLSFDRDREHGKDFEYKDNTIREVLVIRTRPNEPVSTSTPSHDATASSDAATAEQPGTEPGYR